MPEKSSLAVGDHGAVGDFLPTDGGKIENIGRKTNALTAV